MKESAGCVCLNWDLAGPTAGEIFIHHKTKHAPKNKTHISNISSNIFSLYVCFTESVCMHTHTQIHPHTNPSTHKNNSCQTTEEAKITQIMDLHRPWV